MGEVVYTPESTTIAEFPTLLEEQLGLTVKLENLRKNGFVRLHTGQAKLLLSNFLRYESDFFSIEEE